MSAEESRLRWRCRRGMRELDQLLTWYLDRRYAQASASEQQSFASLLDEQDPELWNWFSGRTEPPQAAWKRIVDQIRSADRV